MKLRGALRAAQRRANILGRPVYVWNYRFPYELRDWETTEGWLVHLWCGIPANVAGRPFDFFTVVPE